GATRTFEYDDAQRLTRRAYPDGSDVTFTHTPTGQRATVTDARGTTSYTYDDRDRLIEKTDPNGYKLGYGYDLEGNRTRLTATVGAQVFTTTYTYDELNRAESVTDPQGGVTTLGYDDNGNRQTLAHPNGVTTTYTYDGLSRLSHLETVNSVGTVLQSYAYTLGAAGNRTRIDEHDGTSRYYQYDDLHRLTQDRAADSAGTQVYRRDFTYDPVGNRRTQTIDEGEGPTTITSSYDDRDRLQTSDATSYEWDTNGNLTSAENQGRGTYHWSIEGLLASAIIADGTVIEYLYDPDGIRVSTAVTPDRGTTASIEYLVDTTGPLSHVIIKIVDGSVVAAHTRANDQLISIHKPAGESQRYYHADGSGSIRLLSNEAGEATALYSYSAFGELTQQIGNDDNDYLFVGEPLEPTIGFYYLRARYLDAKNGRFISQDPAQGIRILPITLNLYLYSNDDPVNKSDPTGLQTSTLEVGVATSVASKINYAHSLFLSAAAVVQICAAENAARFAGRQSNSFLDYDCGPGDELVFFRGTTLGSVLEVVSTQRIDVDRIIQNQEFWGTERPGFYMTSQISTAFYYADLAGGSGRGLGPGVLKITVPGREFFRFAAQHQIAVEFP
ncbi:MAG: RHS repeat-associated core domain-containing protein, partial [bacterium]|nr:RHS repeat-associated core domain-containing protein [bacterium]